MEPAVVRLLDVHGDNLRVVYRHFPLSSIHPRAVLASEAAEAAGAQGAFWEMHYHLFETQAEWVYAGDDQVIDLLTGYAEELGLDAEQFRGALENHTYQETVLAEYQQAADMQLSGTPTFIVNGRLYPTNQWGLSYQGLDAFIQLALLEPQQYTEAPPQVIDPANDYIATIRTDKGDIVVQLYAEQAPANVNSFVFLAQEGWYDGVTFHRVIPEFVAQAGDPTGVGVGTPGYQCDDEIAAGLSYDQAGVVGIANAGPNTGSSQFFITYAPLPQLDGGYTIIGQVIEGMDVLQSLTERDPADPAALPGDVIETILIEER